MHFQSTRTIELYAVHYFQHCSIFSLPLWYRLPPTVPIPASTSGGRGEDVVSGDDLINFDSITTAMGGNHCTQTHTVEAFMCSFLVSVQ